MTIRSRPRLTASALALSFAAASGCASRASAPPPADAEGGTDRATTPSTAPEPRSPTAPESSGADTQEAPADQQAGGECALESVYFDYDSASIRADMRSVIEENAACIATRLEQGFSGHVYLEGHTDTRGTDEFNIALGSRQAMAVKRALIGAGVPREIIRTLSYGEEQATGTDESGWVRDRRVDFRLEESATSP